jgi:chemotaxis protein MotB
MKKFLKAAQDAHNSYHRKHDGPPQAEGHDEGNWLISYADMMTLLCGFFIMLFSMSKMDEPKYEQVKEVLSKQFGGQYEAPTHELAKYMAEVLETANIQDKASVKEESQGVSVAFQSTLFFDTLSADVKPEGRLVLDKLAKKLYEKESRDGKQYQIVVEGHTDSRPILAGTFPSNWELSGARASRIVRYFLDNHFAADHMTAVGYADTRPELDARRADGTLDDALLAKNRRVVLRILSPTADSIPLPGRGEGAATQPGGASVQARTQVTAPAAVNTPAPAAARAPASAALPAPAVKR